MEKVKPFSPSSPFKAFQAAILCGVVWRACETCWRKRRCQDEGRPADFLSSRRTLWRSGSVTSRQQGPPHPPPTLSRDQIRAVRPFGVPAVVGLVWRRFPPACFLGCSQPIGCRRQCYVRSERSPTPAFPWRDALRRLTGNHVEVDRGGRGWGGSATTNKSHTKPPGFVLRLANDYCKTEKMISTDGNQNV